jgi:uncharacterized protein (TIGR00297 family)
MTSFLTSWPLAEAVGITSAFGIIARVTGTVSGSGLVGGIIVGSAIYRFSGWPGFVVLGVFFVLASALTRFGYSRKQKLGAAQAEQGKRGARHAAANCAAGVLMAAGYNLNGGDPLWAAGLVASFATAAADTAGSETGPVWGRTTVLAASFRRAAPGTPGAVSLQGTLAGVAAAAVVALAGYVTGLLDSAAIVVLVVTASVAAAWIESVLGGFPAIERILGNEGMNLLNTFLGAILCMAMVSLI